MTDVGKVQGPSGPPENLGRKEKADADADKFKQAMRKRVTEVGRVEPDEQKKRKRREETEEEELEEVPQGPTTPESQVTPFSLEEEKKKVSPLEMQKGGPGLSPLTSAQPLPQPASFQAPSPAEMEDDSGLLEEEAFETPVSSFSGEQAPPPPEEKVSLFEEDQQPIAAAPLKSPQKQLQEGKKHPHREKKVGPPPEKKDLEPPPQAETQKGESLKKAEKKEGLPQPKEKTASGNAAEEITTRKREETSAFFEQMSPDRREKREEKRRLTPEELSEEEIEIQGGAVPPPPIIQTGEEKREKKDEKKEEVEMIETAGAPPGVPEASTTVPPPMPLPSYIHLHPQVMELFDRMVGVMTVMTASGMTETTITLNAPQFASSVFFGAQIIIQEFSTAPKAFNIQLNGSPQAVALFQGNTDDLMAAFQAGNYNFRVNRLETGYLTERPLFKRKEKAEEKGKDQTGENPP